MGNKKLIFYMYILLNNRKKCQPPKNSQKSKAFLANTKININDIISMPKGDEFIMAKKKEETVLTEERLYQIYKSCQNVDSLGEPSLILRGNTLILKIGDKETDATAIIKEKPMHPEWITKTQK